MITKESLAELGLREGSIRADDFVHNGGWYNSDGQKIGWGDLSGEDILRIQSKLKDKECFIVLGESDSYWHFVTFVKEPPDLKANPGDYRTIHRMLVDPKAKNPGLDYIASKIYYLITKQAVYCRWAKESADFRKVKLVPITPEEVLQKMKEDSDGNPKT
jgi:hypothetical protein